MDYFYIMNDDIYETILAALSFWELQGDGRNNPHAKEARRWIYDLVLEENKESSSTHKEQMVIKFDLTPKQAEQFYWAVKNNLSRQDISPAGRATDKVLTTLEKRLSEPQDE